MSSRRRPSATLSVAGRELTLPEAAVHTLVLELGIAAHDRLEVVVGPRSPLDATPAGADVALRLGYDGSEDPVFTGRAVAVGALAWGTRIEALATPAMLAGVRVGRSYLQRSVADIVGDLAAEAHVPVGDLDADVRFPAYHVDERRSAWSHVCALARLAGEEVTTAPDGGLVVRRPRSGNQADHTLRFGADLVDWVSGPATTTTPSPAVVPHGAASSLGSQAWHVVVKEPDGGAPSRFTLVPPAVRDTDTATTVADWAARAAERRRRRGRAVTVGDPAIRAGHLVELAGIAAGAPAVHRVIACTHRLSDRGFRSELVLEGTA